MVRLSAAPAYHRIYNLLTQDYILRLGDGPQASFGMLERFSSTIDMLYAAATNARCWPAALASIEDLTASAGAVVGFIPKAEGGCGFNLAGRFTDEQCAIYSSTYQPICRRTRYMIEHPELDVIYDSLLISEREMDSDPVYDWFGRHDLRYFVGTSLQETREYRVVCSLQRSRSQGHVQAPDIELFRLLTPHLARAINLADELGTLRSHNRFCSAMLEAMPQAVFALDDQATLLFANVKARQLFASRDGLQISTGQIMTAAPDEQRLLDQAIQGALKPHDGHSTCWIRISRPSGRSPYAVFVSPLHVAENELTAAVAKVLVVVHDPASQRPARSDMLTSLYGLTETEARLASALSGGHSVESAAALLRIQPSTARAHLKAVFRKVGVNRQQDLVRLLAFLSTTVPAI